MLFLAFSASAQFVLVNSPASIAGSKVFRGSETWAVADLTSGIWTADAVFVDDGTAPTTDGCGDPVNGAAISGKIALIDRGTCQFGDKALRAQTAGALAVVIFNNAAGAGVAGMAAGDFGAMVTIPVVMLTYEDGQVIRTTLMTEAVNMTIGNVQFPNDLSIGAKSIVNAFNGVMPANQAEALGVSFTPAANVLNKGTNDATDVILQTTISHTPLGGSTATQLYDESGDVAFLENDSATVIQLAEFTPAEGEGIYTVTYSVTASEDDSPLVNTDQEVTTEFVFSENAYCKGRWDFANNRPRTTAAYTTGTFGDREYLAGFSVPEGVGYQLDSVVFFAQGSTTFGSLVGNIGVWVYEWDDANADETVANDELTIVAFTPSDFLGITDTAATTQWLKVPLVNFEDIDIMGYQIPDDNKRYFVGVRYENSNSVDRVFFGFDEGYDQTANIDILGALTSDIEVPYWGINAWVSGGVPDFENGFRFTDFWGSLATGLIINTFESPSIEVAPSNVAVALSPNPANSQLVVESKLKSVTGGITYTIRDNAGRMVYNSSKTLNTDYDKVSFDVSQYAAGQYFIVVTTDQGIKAERFTVQH